MKIIASLARQENSVFTRVGCRSFDRQRGISDEPSGPGCISSNFCSPNSMSDKVSVLTLPTTLVVQNPKKIAPPTVCYALGRSPNRDDRCLGGKRSHYGHGRDSRV